MIFCIYVGGNPANAVDPWGLSITRYIPDPNRRTPDDIIGDTEEWLEHLDEEYGDIWEAMRASEEAASYTYEMSFGECSVRCFAKALFGDALYDGQLATMAEQQMGEIALELAKKKGLKSITKRIGAYLVPVLGTASSIYTGILFVRCFKNCCSKE